MDTAATHRPNQTRRWRSIGALTTAALVAVSGLGVSVAAALTPVSVEITVATKTYDGTTTATITGCSIVETVADDVSCDAAGASVEFSSANPDTAIALTINTGATLSGADASGYEIVAQSGTGTIDPAVVDATALVVEDKDYDGSDDATVSSCTLTGVLGTESVDCAGTGTFASPNAGAGISVTIDSLTLTGTDAGNYSLGTAPTTGSATINALTLMVDPDDQSVTYGDTAPDATFYTYALSGFAPGEDETNADGYSAPTCGSTYADGDGVGTTSITCTAGTATNYTFDITGTGTLTIEPATLTVTPDTPGVITYGDSTPTPLTYTVDGFVNENSESDAGYSAPSCTVAYASGDAAGDYSIDCAGGSYANYEFSYDTATLTVKPFELTPLDVWYTGQTAAYTASASETVAQVTLSASITADLDGAAGADGCVDGGASVADGTVTFTDELSGRVLARNVPIAEVDGNCEEGIATTFATLSTGQNGTDMYVIIVTVGGSFDGSNDDTGGQTDTDLPSTRVAVSLPVAPGTVQGIGSLPVIAGTTPTELGTKGSLTTDMNGEAAMTTFRFVPGTRKLAPKGQAVLAIPAGDDYYLVKTNSITSVTVSGSVTTVLAKANITYVGTCLTTCISDGNVSVRIDYYDEATDRVGFTIQSSKSSVLYYSNDWYKEVRAWKTRGHILS